MREARRIFQVGQSYNPLWGYRGAAYPVELEAHKDPLQEVRNLGSAKN